MHFCTLETQSSIKLLKHALTCALSSSVVERRPDFRCWSVPSWFRMQRLRDHPSGIRIGTLHAVQIDPDDGSKTKKPSTSSIMVSRFYDDMQQTTVEYPVYIEVYDKFISNNCTYYVVWYWLQTCRGRFFFVEIQLPPVFYQFIEMSKSDKNFN